MWQIWAWSLLRQLQPGWPQAIYQILWVWVSSSLKWENIYLASLWVIDMVQWVDMEDIWHTTKMVSCSKSFPSQQPVKPAEAWIELGRSLWAFRTQYSPILRGVSCEEKHSLCLRVGSLDLQENKGSAGTESVLAHLRSTSLVCELFGVGVCLNGTYLFWLAPVVIISAV